MPSRASACSGASAGRRCSWRVLTSQSLFFGAMDVLFVVLAIDELGMGDSGVGVLNAAFGAGGLLARVRDARPRRDGGGWRRR